MKRRGDFVNYSSNRERSSSRRPLREQIEEEDDDFAQIAHPSGKQSLDIDDALANIPLEGSDLLGAASSSPVDNSSVVPMEGLE